MRESEEEEARMGGKEKGEIYARRRGAHKSRCRGDAADAVCLEFALRKLRSFQLSNY